MKKQREFEAAPSGRACAQLGQYCDGRLIQNLPSPTVNYGTDDAHQRAEAAQRARQAQEQQQLDQDARIREAEIAKEHAEHEAERQRQAQVQAARAKAEWKAEQARAQQAAQAAYERQQAEAEAERQRQAQWQQQVNLTTSLLQGSIQSSERALANSRAELNEIVAMNSKEDEVLARVLAKAKAAQAQPEAVAAARPMQVQSEAHVASASAGGSTEAPDQRNVMMLGEDSPEAGADNPAQLISRTEFAGGCYMYEFLAEHSDSLVSLTWSGRCEPGKPVNGRGRVEWVTTNLASKRDPRKEHDRYSLEGTMANGRFRGSVKSASYIPWNPPDAQHQSGSGQYDELGCVRSSDPEDSDDEYAMCREAYSAFDAKQGR